MVFVSYQMSHHNSWFIIYLSALYYLQWKAKHTRTCTYGYKIHSLRTFQDHNLNTSTRSLVEYVLHVVYSGTESSCHFVLSLPYVFVLQNRSYRYRSYIIFNCKQKQYLKIKTILPNLGFFQAYYIRYNYNEKLHELNTARKTTQ